MFRQPMFIENNPQQLVPKQLVSCGRNRSKVD